MTVENRLLIFAPRSHMSVALNRTKMLADTHGCLGEVLPAVFGVKRPFERERGSAEHAPVIPKLRRHHPKLPILPRADEFGQFGIENRNQQWIVLSQAASQKQSLGLIYSGETSMALMRG